MIMNTFAIPSRSAGKRSAITSAAADISAGTSIDSPGKMHR